MDSGENVETSESAAITDNQENNLTETQNDQRAQSPEQEVVREVLTNGSREPTNVQIGKRSATLFLSSHSLQANTKSSQSATTENSTLSDVRRSRTSSRTLRNTSRRSSQRTESVTESIPDECIQHRLQKEFTFADYDIMADGRYC